VLEGGQYTIDLPSDQLPSSQAKPDVPLDLLEARNAVVIAKAAGAEQYAQSSIAKAEDMLQRAEDYYQRKQGRTPIGTAARGATQMAEDARVLALRRAQQEREEAARRASQQAQAKAEADAQAAKQQSDEDARRRADAEHAQAEAEKAQANAQAQQQAAQAQADTARLAAQNAQLQQEAAERDRQEAERQKQEAIQQKEQLRARLLAQLNQVLQTRDTARGLIVSMPDVLFDINKYTLKPEARERLARISGIVLAYPDLNLQIEGHTDSTGSDEYNQTLSEKRASSVRGYLLSSGVTADHVNAVGLGKADPVADNSTAAGRKLNRRVDLVVSGDVIGARLTPEASPVNPPSNNQ
jgi:outer membrane protein OmpA-like peptidoglycan-associated protein